VTLLKKLCLIIIGSRSNSALGKAAAYTHLSDEELVRAIVKDNNSMLFGILYDRYARKVYNKCYGFSKSDDEAEDLTQDVFLMLFVKLGSFKGKSKFSSWLYSLTYNFCVNYVNRNKERKMSDQSDQIENSEHKLPVEIDDLDLFQMRSGKLKKALNMISPEDKTLLLLK